MPTTSPRSTIGTPSIERTSHERIVDLIGRVSLRVSWTTTGAFVATISRVNASPAPPEVRRLTPSSMSCSQCPTWPR